MFKNNANSAPKVTGVRLNTSVYGAAIPFLFGRARLTPRLIWQNDFSYYMTSQGKKGKSSQAITQTSP
jgi:hypothetical protein